MSLTAYGFSVLSTIAYAVLTLAGFALWKRGRSVATALLTVGFAMILAVQLTLLIQDIQFRAILRGHSSDTLFIVHHHALLRYVELAGLWLAALGLVSYALGMSGRKHLA